MTIDTASPPGTIDEVIVRLNGILDDALRQGARIGYFAALYERVTTNVRRALVAGNVFQDNPRMERLDVVFADRFLEAWDTYSAGGAPSRSWQAAFALLDDPQPLAVQHLLLGMNAHINRDLPVALVATCHELGLGLGDDSREHSDFERVDSLLARVETHVKSAYVTGWLAWIDRLIHRFQRIDDVVAMWDVGRARDAAWINAQALWALGVEQPLAEDYLRALDRMVGLASRGLLVPADSWLLKLGRVLSR